MQYLLFALIVWWSLPEAEETIPRENPNTPRSISSVYPTSSLLFPFFFLFDGRKEITPKDDSQGI